MANSEFHIRLKAGGTQKVEGRVFGDLGIHKGECGLWSLTDLKTGLCLSRFRHLNTARRIAKSILDDCYWPLSKKAIYEVYKKEHEIDTKGF